MFRRGGGVRGRVILYPWYIVRVTQCCIYSAESAGFSVPFSVAVSSFRPMFSPGLTPPVATNRIRNNKLNVLLSSLEFILFCRVSLFCVFLPKCESSDLFLSSTLKKYFRKSFFEFFFLNVLKRSKTRFFEI